MKNGLVKPVTKSDNAIIYTPRKGFRINLDEIVDPEGTYVCKAQYNGIERSVEYRVVTLLGGYCRFTNIDSKLILITFIFN